jgi:hypothetical protein
MLSQAGTASYGSVIAAMIVLGVGIGVTLPIFSLAVQNAVPPSQAGMATGTIQFVRSLGGSLGAAIFGAVLSNRYAPGLGGGEGPLAEGPKAMLAGALHDVFLVAALLVGLGIIATLRLVDIPLRTTNREPVPDAS